MPGKKERPAGSLKTGEPAFLAAGKFRRPHGVHGDILVELFTQFPERLSPGKLIYIGEEYEEFTLLRQRTHKDGLLLGFEGFNTPEAIGRFRNQVLYVSRADSLELQSGEYYHHELLDLKVVDENGYQLGTLTEIIETGANDVYVVTTPSGAEILLPVIPEVVKAVNLDDRRMIVHLLPGLVEEPDNES